MNILAIGNSFSQDATRYLHDIARGEGVNLEVVNLYIGGCSLDRHFRNIMDDKKAYELEVDGHKTGFMVSVKDALLNREWDIVTLQQVSGKSGKYETFAPYLEELACYVKKYAPNAKLYIHQTWAYEDESKILYNNYNTESGKEMYMLLEAAYKKAYEDISADGIIESGKLMMKLLDSGIEKIHRDTFHLTYGLGRYAAGLLWYSTICQKPVDTVKFCDFDEAVSDEEIAIVKKCINEIR